MNPNTLHHARVALEWWRSSGPRTLVRLQALCEHQATHWAGESAGDIFAAAQAMTMSWEMESDE